MNRVIVFALTLSLLFIFPFAVADTVIPKQAAYFQDSQICGDTNIIIDVPVTIAIPEQVCEWQTTVYSLSESELRQLISFVSPEDTRMKSHIARGNDISLYNNITETIAIAGDGHVEVSHPGKLQKYDYGTIGMHTFYISHNPSRDVIPSLTAISYSDALVKLLPAINLITGASQEPSYVEAWNALALDLNSKKYSEMFSRNGSDQEWTATEEIYVIEFPVYYKGLQLHNGDGTVHNGSMLCPAGIKCLISCTEILSFQLNHCMFSNSTQTSVAKTPLPLDTIVELYYNMHTQLSNDGQHEKRIEQISLEYIVLLDGKTSTMTYRLVPAWCFYYKKDVPEHPRGYYYEVDMMHAVTGVSVY